jgi:hypothetical protein
MPIAQDPKTVFTLPLVGGIAASRFTVTIDGARYAFVQRWNSTDSAWYLDVSDSAGASIAGGLKIVLGAFIGREYNHPLFRAGVFVAHDATGQKREATFNDIGQRVAVRWIPALEIARRRRLGELAIA